MFGSCGDLNQKNAKDTLRCCFILFFDFRTLLHEHHPWSAGARSRRTDVSVVIKLESIDILDYNSQYCSLYGTGMQRNRLLEREERACRSDWLYVGGVRLFGRYFYIW